MGFLSNYSENNIKNELNYGVKKIASPFKENGRRRGWQLPDVLSDKYIIQHHFENVNSFCRKKDFF